MRSTQGTIEGDDEDDEECLERVVEEEWDLLDDDDEDEGAFLIQNVSSYKFYSILFNSKVWIDK